MMSIKVTHVLGVVSVVVLLMAEVQQCAAVTCNATELSSCLPAVTLGQNPSALCCAKLKEQQPCFCQYLSDPAYKSYLDSPNAKKMVSMCGVTIPKC